MEESAAEDRESDPEPGAERARGASDDSVRSDGASDEGKVPETGE